MSIPAKILMRWNVRTETEDSEYYEFLVHEFIPGLNNLGLAEIQIWATAFGECEQKLVSGIAQTVDDMKAALHSEDWVLLTEKLDDFVEGYSQKVVPATAGFQI
jgi:hypothetical protein